MKGVAQKAGGAIIVTLEDVLSILPHRGRALLVREDVTVDTVLRAGTTKFVVTPEDCEGHFPGMPVFPGKNWVELIAQLLGVVASVVYDTKEKGVLAAGTMKFRSIVVPGEMVVADVIIGAGNQSRARGSGMIRRGAANGEVIAEIEKLTLVRVQPRS